MLAYSFILALVLGFVIDKTIGFRVTRRTRSNGIDLAEHAETAYDFGGTGGGSFGVRAHRSPSDRRGGERMKLVTAVIKPFKLDDVKAALEAFGVHGLTVSEAAATAASGATPRSTGGRSTPSTWCPRCGSRCSSTTPTPTTSSTSSSRPRQTGRIGDGKVWSIPVDTVVRVRTGERGPDAL